VAKGFKFKIWRYLFGSGQLLDANKYFIILTDDIGHGDSNQVMDYI
jgi:homoserine O-acetyltransferase